MKTKKALQQSLKKMLFARSECETQREWILTLLKMKPFVSTREISRFSYQYNARIYELRRGVHDGKKYDIQSQRNDRGTNGFSLQGWR